MHDEIIDFLVELVKINTVNPPGDTTKAFALVEKKLKEVGIKYSIEKIQDDKPNIIARIGEGKPELCFNSHLDVVPPGALENWTHDPFGAEIADGIIYGRGCADAKANTAAMVMAAKAIVEEGINLKGTMILNPVSDEESGGLAGVRVCLDKGLRPDYVVIGEQTDNRIAIAEKGGVWFWVKTKGRAAHASIPWEGISAIDKMRVFLNEVDERIAKKIAKQSHPATAPPSLCIGTISGGVRLNVVPDSCEITIDRRMIPGQTTEEIKKEVFDIIEDLKRKDPEFEADVVVLAEAHPFETSPDEKLVKAAQEACRELNLNPKPTGYAQTSDGRFFAEIGIPTIIIGPSDPKVGHQPDEHFKVEDVVDTTKIYALISTKMLSE
ncbi:MAG: M20 family metallopeptidase [Candidatus Jordarchaeum sp.]|uniref:M20 family metallopeptidase n=1 Tax=Candidatus Jordarchaeum sp. TaxID=2823881 RepID=UPI00404ABB8B